MNQSLDAIREVARRLVADANLCPPGELAIRLRERAATLRCAVVPLALAFEPPPEATQSPASA
ncbi:hypothetical protein [Acidocella sp.]|uniref:hypothetical protein n=1 Tax=Acidocella sp. TaxID=50710 RepID=UPI003D07AAC7